MVSQFRDLLGLLDALVFLYIALRITLDIKQRRFLTIDAYLSLALVVARIVALFALGTSNYGTALSPPCQDLPVITIALPVWKRHTATSFGRTPISPSSPIQRRAPPRSGLILRPGV